MAFMTPSSPDVQVSDETDDSFDAQKRRELAIQRARQLQLQNSRQNLIIDPATRGDGDNGLAVRR